MTDEARSKTGLKRNMIQQAAEVEYNGVLLGAFLRCSRYGSTERLGYAPVVLGREGSGALLYASLDSIKLWYALSNCRLIQNMAVDRMLALVTTSQLSEIDKDVLEEEGRSAYNYDEAKTIASPAELLLVRRRVGGAEVHEGR